MTKASQKLSVYFIVLFMVFTSSNVLAYEEDSEPPVLYSLEISPTTLNVGDTLEIVADIKDDLSGVNE